MILNRIFTKHNFDVVTAENGFEAFNKVKNSIDGNNNLFEIIILDLNMPIMNGIEACKKINKLFNQSSNPLIKLP